MLLGSKVVLNMLDIVEEPQSYILFELYMEYFMSIFQFENKVLLRLYNFIHPIFLYRMSNFCVLLLEITF